VRYIDYAHVKRAYNIGGMMQHLIDENAPIKAANLSVACAART